MLTPKLLIAGLLIVGSSALGQNPEAVGVRLGPPSYPRLAMDSQAGTVRLPGPGKRFVSLASNTDEYLYQIVPPDMVVFGEIGLGGEVRPVGQREARLREAAKLGFRSALIPRAQSRSGGGTSRASEGIRVDEIEHLSDLVARFQPADRPMKRSRRDSPSDRGRA